MKKKNLFKWCFAAMLAASIVFLGCPDPGNINGGATVDTLGVPDGIEINDNGAGNIDVTWEAVKDATKYEVAYGIEGQVNLDDAETYESVEVTGLTANLTLEIDTSYSITVRAGIEAGWSNKWSTAKLHTPSGIPVPANLAVVSGDTSLAVSWEAVAEAVYEVRWSLNGTDWSTAEDITSLTYTIENLSNDVEYTVEVCAVIGEEKSRYRSTRAIPAAPPVEGAPVDKVVYDAIVGYEIGGTAQDATLQTVISGYTTTPSMDALSGIILVNWKAIEGATSYDVFVASATDTTVPAKPATATVSTNKLVYAIRDCTPDTTYYIWVVAMNDIGRGPVNASISAKLTEAQKVLQTAGSIPANGIERANYPQNLRAAVVGNGEVRLSWDKSDRAVWYEVYYHTEDIVMTPTLIGEEWTESQGRLVPYKKIAALQDAATPWNDQAGTAGVIGEVHKIYNLDTTVTGLDPAKKYWFWVRGLNHNGERGLAKVSNLSVGTSTGATLSKPTTTVKAQTPGGGKMLTVEWTPVNGATGYIIYYSRFNFFSTELSNKRANGSTTTNTILRDLQEKSRYYVWVVATGADGARSDPSDVQSEIVPELDGHEPAFTEKMGIWGEPLKNYVYVEVNDNDPRVALNWELESGEKFFDVVILFAANLRTRDCLNATPADKATHQCTQNGPHIHYNGNFQHILTNRDKYIKPLQDAGIKVLMGLLGDHDPFIYYALGQWPGTQSWELTSGTIKNDYTRWGGAAANTEYPLGPAGRDRFLTHLAEEINKYGLDGFDMDDEWSTFSTGTNSAIVNRNNAEFIRIMREKLGPDAIISVYQWHTLGSMNSGQFDENAGTGKPESLVDINPNIWKYATMGGYASYGGSGNPWGGIPNSQYAPFALNAGSRSGSQSYTNYTNADPKYGWVLWYDLDARSVGGQAMFDFINRYAQNLYGKNVIYGGDGLDYPQDWAKW